MIKPTVGRQVHFWFHSQNRDSQSPHIQQPQAATVCYVHHDRLVNLDVISHEGHHTPRYAVELRQDDDPIPTQDYCEWMPYQKQVAAGEIPPVKHAT